jgi:hypothetical protein
VWAALVEAIVVVLLCGFGWMTRQLPTSERDSGNLLSDLLAAAGRAAGLVRRQTRYDAFLSDDYGKLRVFRIWARNLVEAEREAHTGARSMRMTVEEVRPAVRSRLGAADNG